MQYHVQLFLLLRVNYFTTERLWHFFVSLISNVSVNNFDAPLFLKHSIKDLKMGPSTTYLKYLNHYQNQKKKNNLAFLAMPQWSYFLLNYPTDVENYFESWIYKSSYAQRNLISHLPTDILRTSTNAIVPL